MAVDYKNRVVVNCATGTTEEIALTDEEIAARVARDKAWESGAADRAWASIREERDNRLAATDYFALSDVTMSDAMTSYRSSLRNLPANTADPVVFQTAWYDFVNGKDGVSDPWPTKP